MSELPTDRNVLLEIKPLEDLIEEPLEPKDAMSTETLEPHPEEPLPEEEPEEKIFKKKKRKKRTVTPALRAHLAECRKKSAATRRKKSKEKKRQKAKDLLGEGNDNPVESEEDVAEFNQSFNQPPVATVSEAPTVTNAPAVGNDMDNFFNNFERFVNFVDRLDTVRETRHKSPLVPTSSAPPPTPPPPPPQSEASAQELLTRPAGKYDGFF